jgi:hypothetical protein
MQVAKENNNSFLIEKRGNSIQLLIFFGVNFFVCFMFFYIFLYFNQHGKELLYTTVVICGVLAGFAAIVPAIFCSKYYNRNLKIGFTFQIIKLLVFYVLYLFVLCYLFIGFSPIKQLDLNYYNSLRTECANNNTGKECENKNNNDECKKNSDNGHLKICLEHVDRLEERKEFPSSYFYGPLGCPMGYEIVMTDYGVGFYGWTHGECSK